MAKRLYTVSNYAVFFQEQLEERRHRTNGIRAIDISAYMLIDFPTRASYPLTDLLSTHLTTRRPEVNTLS
jgi:hypothetical protein